MQQNPVVFESGVFALKGGTAINLFVRDMPRLSALLGSEVVSLVDHCDQRFRGRGISRQIEAKFLQPIVD